MRKRIYPSSSAFQWGDLVLTDYDSGCLRSILLRAHGADTPIPDIYAKVGAAHEEWYEGQLKADPRLITYAREVPVKFPIDGMEEVTYSGRIDVLSTYLNVGQVIHETKGTISKNTRLSVIRKGQVKLNQLAQTVSYMIAKEILLAKLVVGYYEENEAGELVHQEGRTFKIRIADDGAILVDDTPSGFTVADQIRHRQSVAKVLSTNTIGARPDKADQKWGGPCTHCVFKDVCDKYDRGELTGGVDQFVDAGRDAAWLASQNPKPEPVPFKIKVRKSKSA